MKDRVFGVLQRVGRSFMLPIALLPAAGLLLGVGGSFTNQTMLETYGLDGIVYPGSLLYTVLDIMNLCGSAVFGNLPLLFAMGVAIGMAKKEKEVAALSGAIAYLVMNTAISAMIRAAGGEQAMAENAVTESLGIVTLQMGVFGGIIVGLGVAALHNRFYKIQLPQVLSFFGGTRFVPIISTAVYLVVGVILFYVWPLVQGGIARLGGLVIRSGYAGTWVYGIIERALIPFGLHHVFYMPFWQTAVGGTAVIDGAVVQGAQNIFFAELASRETEVFSVSAARFMSGKFPFMIFGLPGAALAMYRCAREDRKKTVGGLLLSAALTSMLTGITEPIEFTFLFVAPLMYAVHCVLAGLSYMLMHILRVGVGMTFSGGLIDLTLFGILQGNAKTNWIRIVLVGVVYFVLYYFVFTLLIRRFDLKTPGREADGEETKLYTRADYKEKTGIGPDGVATPGKASDRVSEQIVRGLGGRENIADVDCCATRLRVTVADAEKVSESMLRASGASGVIRKGNGIQIVYGPQVAVIKSNLTDYMDAPGTEREEKVWEEDRIKPLKAEVLGAHMRGTAVPLSEVPDEVFSASILGEGAAIEPVEGKLFAPTDGVVESVVSSGHAVSLAADCGAELLLHIGIDTIELNGLYFEPHVAAGQRVKKGDLLVSFDREAVQKAGYATVTPMIVCNSDRYEKTETLKVGKVQAGEDFLSLHIGNSES